MSDTDAQPNATPLSDLRKGALAHYEEISLRACNWYSVIPRAINFYYDAEEAKAALLRPSPPEGPQE